MSQGCRLGNGKTVGRTTAPHTTAKSCCRTAPASWTLDGIVGWDILTKGQKKTFLDSVHGTAAPETLIVTSLLQPSANMGFSKALFLHLAFPNSEVKWVQSVWLVEPKSHSCALVTGALRHWVSKPSASAIKDRLTWPFTQTQRHRHYHLSHCPQ